MVKHAKQEYFDGRNEHGSRQEAIEVFRNTTVCVTGATGLIGSAFVKYLLRANKDRALNCTVVILVRNKDKAMQLFGASDQLVYYDWTLQDPIPPLAETVDYLIHAAAPTASAAFVERPVETISAIVDGTRAILEFCYKQALDLRAVKKTVFLSTMEVYGETEGEVFETSFGSLDPMNVRNSYPEAKKLAECLCASYASEYEVPCCVLRLAQTFGAGVDPSDKRVFSEFAGCALRGKEIVLYSDGSKKNVYLSLDDAIQAILVACKRGVPGEAYNAANPTTYCSVLEMARFVQKTFNQQTDAVIFKTDAERAKTFRKSSDLLLNTNKLEELGWNAEEGLEIMYADMVREW